MYTRDIISMVKKGCRSSCLQWIKSFEGNVVLFCNIKTKHSENNYSCEDCDATFSRCKVLGHHVHTVHNEKLYTCQHCEQK